jgi:hypothetical protein
MGLESDTHAFIVKIWSEEAPQGGDERQLRGHITDAYTKDRGAVHELADILAFIKPYLKSMGVKLCRRSRLMLWFSSARRWKKGTPSG